MITEKQKEEALQVLAQYAEESDHNIRGSIEEDCPSKDYEEGTPEGRNCEGDGHYLCNQCIHLKV